jgi:hypothetical protein
MGGGTKGISEFVEGLRLTARQIGGGKETSTKHKRKQSGFPTPEGTLALGYTYIDIFDEENDGSISMVKVWTDGRYPGSTHVLFVP